MHESLPTQTPPETFAPEADQGHDVLAVLEAQRAAFVDAMTERGMISQDLATSGELDNFVLDVPSQADALVHMLVGDRYGGGHHLRTMMELEVPDRVVASEISGSQPLAKLRRQQKVRPDGTYRSRVVAIDGLKKMHGSTMFPDEWSTEDVIRGVLAVSQTAPTRHDLERGSYIHEGNVGGVDMTVITSEHTGKIIMGSPR